MVVDSQRDTPRKRVVLVGLGHAHLAVVAEVARFRKAGAELVLIDPGAFWYSGLGTAMLAGRYEREDDTVDAARLCEALGVTFIRGRVGGIDRAERWLRLEESLLDIPYDLVSFNIGSRIAGNWPIDDRRIWAVKPVRRLLDLRRALLAAGDCQRIVVVGGGVTGAEFTGNLLALGAAHGRDLHVTLVAGKHLMSEAPAGAPEHVRRALERRGAVIVEGSRYQALEGERIRLDDGKMLAFDHLVFATGLEAEPLIGELGLPAENKSGLRVAQALHSIADNHVFAAGDCASIEGFERPNIGVFGVRAGPYLTDNLLASLKGGRLRDYKPQTKWLQILDLGDGTGLAMRGRRWRHGRPMLWLKNAIDRRFVRKYQRLYGGTP